MRSHVRVAWAACAAVALAGCGPLDRGEDHDVANVAVTANALGTPVATIVITVSASDIATPLVFNLTLQNGVATETIRVPPGTARTIAARAFDSDGAVASEGSLTIDVERGTNPPVSIPMVARTGNVPVTVTLGPVSIAISPATAAVPVGSTVQLAATIRASNGQVLEVAPEWATTDPTVVSVSASGLVTALRVGQAQIVATYAGVAGVAAISATGGVRIDAVAFDSTTVSLGGSTGYTATLTNPTGRLVGGLDIQGWIRQGTAERAAGGTVLGRSCGPLLGDFAAGTCQQRFALFANNQGVGSGTLVPGGATAVVQLRNATAEVLSEFTAPITLR